MGSFPESSTNETHDAIVALNAAAIIARIKLQSEQTKRTRTDSNTNGKGDPTLLGKTASKHLTLMYTIKTWQVILLTEKN